MSNEMAAAMVAVGLVGAVLTAVVWVAFRIRVLRPLRATVRSFDYRMLPVTDLAFLAGGARRAILAAMASSRVGVGPAAEAGGAADPLVERAARLDWNVHDGEGAVSACSGELAAIRGRLESAGLLLSHEAAAGTRTITTCIGAVVFLAELGLGILAWRDGASLREAAMAVFIMFFFSFWLPGLIFSPGRKARAVGRPLVVRARKDFAYLSPRRAKRSGHQTPAQPNGAWEKPLATALFGGWAIMHHSGEHLSPLWASLSISNRGGAGSVDYGTLGDFSDSSDGGATDIGGD